MTDEEIERMRKIINYAIGQYASDPFPHGQMDKCIAIDLSAHGIGDKKQAVKEAFEKLKDKAETTVYETNALPRGDERYSYSYEAVTTAQIDEFFTELYGADE